MTRLNSIIDELNNFVPDRDKHLVIESRAKNAIAACINLMSLIEESFDDEQAKELNQRLLLSIKNRDSAKICRKIKEYAKTSKKSL